MEQRVYYKAERIARDVIKNIRTVIAFGGQDIEIKK